MRITCPTCRQATTWEENKHRPFCSERCRLIDLGQWATGGYAIPGDPAPGSNEHVEDAGRAPEEPGA